MQTLYFRKSFTPVVALLVLILLGIGMMIIFGWTPQSTEDEISFWTENNLGQNPCNKNSSESTKERSSRCILESKNLMLTAECEGRLGNQMSDFATLFAFARYNNRTAFMSPTMSDFISKYFPVSLATIHPSLLSSTTWRTNQVGGQVFRLISGKEHVKLVGTPQNWRYYDEFRSEIRQEFQFPKYIVGRVEMELLNVRLGIFAKPEDIESAIVVGVHVRRRDYLEAAEIGQFHIPSIQFYKGAMSYFKEKYQNVIFLFVSSDTGWCRENLGELAPSFQISYLEGAPEELGGMDLAVLSHCDHVIFGLGSFGYWAGYLSLGEVIYCSDCITSDSFWLRDRAVYNGDYANVVLPSWIGYSRSGVRNSTVAKSNNLI